MRRDCSPPVRRGSWIGVWVREPQTRLDPLNKFLLRGVVGRRRAVEVSQYIGEIILERREEAIRPGRKNESSRRTLAPNLADMMKLSTAVEVDHDHSAVHADLGVGPLLAVATGRHPIAPGHEIRAGRFRIGPRAEASATELIGDFVDRRRVVTNETSRRRVFP